MTPNYHKIQKAGACQDLHSTIFWNALPEPSLWNSQMGRRQFLGKIGKGSIATIIALNSLKLNSIASTSASCGLKNVRMTRRFTQDHDVTSTKSSGGPDGSAAKAKRKAIHDILLRLIEADELIAVDEVYVNVPNCATSPVGPSAAGFAGGAPATVTEWVEDAVWPLHPTYWCTVTVHDTTISFVTHLWTQNVSHPTSTSCSP